MVVKRFEDLRCWQAARELVRLVFLAARSGELAKDVETRFQIKKAALSSMNNIAEGFGRFGVKDSIKFYDISQSSTLEVKSMLYVLSDLQYLTSQQIEEVKRKAEETRNLTLAFIKHQRKKLSQKNRQTLQVSQTPTHQHKKNKSAQKSRSTSPINTSTQQHINTSS